MCSFSFENCLSIGSMEKQNEFIDFSLPRHVVEINSHSILGGRKQDNALLVNEREQDYIEIKQKYCKRQTNSSETIHDLYRTH